MSKAEQNGTKTRADARIVWSQDAQRNAEIVEEREKSRKAGAEKTARLRELRLAREAEAARHKPAPKRKATSVRSKKA